MEEAINQLEVLGITRTQAKKALARYNNDVSRAADFIFSGNYISDSEENELELVEETEQSEALALSLSLEEQNKATEPTVSIQPATTNSSDLSLVVYKDSKETFDQQVPDKSETTKDTISDFSLTWWKNPENPSERKATDNVPIGLRPPAYSFNYAPIVVQALFHVTYFQLAVASYKHIPPSWGEPANYWKGKGEHIPGYITIKKPRKPKENIEKDSENYNNIDETLIREELTESSQEEDVEVKAIPKCLQVIGELQKIFAFLGNTKRGYGSVADFTKTLNTKTNFWDEDDIYFESFLDLLINPIVECDEFSDVLLPSNQKLKSMFAMSAKIECGDKCEEEELYYLTINPEKGTTSFYDSLDPLVFENYESDSDAEYPYKFTSFERISPLVFIVLENRYKVDYEYRIDNTIFLDRYMHENKDKVLDGFLKMQSYRTDIIAAQKKINDLKEKHHGYSKSELLNETIKYFQEKEESDKEADALLSVLENIQKEMSDSLQKHEALMKEHKKEIYSVFDRDDMKKKPYTLRATFHHDGKSGTGHYWAYIWVEEIESSLLKDLPAEGGWFKFCDAQVTPAKEEDIFNDPIPPFSLMYIDESLPKFTKASIYEQLPQELKEFIKKDNEQFEGEISNYSQLADTPYPVYDDHWTTEKTEEYQIEQAAFDDSNSIGTAVGQANTDAEAPKFIGQGYTKLKEQTNRKIVDVSGYDYDDYRILMSFEIFLAKTQNQQGLEHLYLLYSKDPDENGNQTVNEAASRHDEYLKFAWDQYEFLLTLGKKVSKALCYFIKKEYQMALRVFLEVKRTEVSWKTQIMLNLDLHAYSSIDVISFRFLSERYGKKCLEILNRAAFKKALNVSYRSRGLEDALRIAHQAHAMIGPDAISTDNTYASMRELWLSFGEQGNSEKLTGIETDLLNTLVMTYLEGQSGQSVDPMDKTEALDTDTDEKPDDMPIWMYYKNMCEEAKVALHGTDL